MNEVERLAAEHLLRAKTSGKIQIEKEQKFEEHPYYLGILVGMELMRELAATEAASHKTENLDDWDAGRNFTADQIASNIRKLGKRVGPR